MIFWALFSLLVVAGVKYYASVRMRQLERRLRLVKDDLLKAKDQYRGVHDKENEVESDESHFEERIRRMKEVIQDVQLRLTSSGEPKEAESE